MRFEDVIARLREVAKGDVTLRPSPEETVRQIEEEAGKPLPDDLQQWVYSMRSKSDTDTSNQKAAVRMLRIVAGEG